MAAPGPTARGTPAGLPLRDGFATMITLGANDDVSFWEKETTPPGKDGGDPIDITTFHNTARRTKWNRELLEDTDISGVCAYDPAVETDLELEINKNQEITITFNDGSTKAIWGFLKEFTPQSHTDGDMPEANFVIVASNVDASYAEQAPVVSSVAGT